jgi:hypothetical protein
MNVVGTTVRIELSSLMFLDNAGWFGGTGLDLLRNGRDISFFSNPSYIRRSTWDVVHRLNDRVFAGGLVVSNARELSYQVIVYTPLRAWYSRMWNTPHPEERLAELAGLFQSGRDLAGCGKTPVVAVPHPSRRAPVERSSGWGRFFQRLTSP